MIVKNVTKLWQGKFVSVRDYEVKKAISQGGMVLTHNGDKMTLTVDELKNLKPSPAAGIKLPRTFSYGQLWPR